MAIIGDLRSHNQSNSVTLLASAARTSTGTANDSYMLPPSPSGVAFELDLTAAATDSGSVRRQSDIPREVTVAVSSIAGTEAGAAITVAAIAKSAVSKVIATEPGTVVAVIELIEIA